jgi:hypothetical protein
VVRDKELKLEDGEAKNFMFIIAVTARARGEYRAEQQQRSERVERGDLAEGVCAGLCRGELLGGKAKMRLEDMRCCR